MTEPSEAIEAKFQQALDLHMQGQLGPAEVLYNEILRAEPEHFHALHLLGIVAGQRGQAQTAIDFINRAIAIDPNDAATYSNRGNALRELARYDEALASYDRALAIQPDSAEVLDNRGLVLHQLNRYEEALASYDRALAIQPDVAETLCHRGLVHYQLQRYEDALASYDRALAIQPASADILDYRGRILYELKRYEEALASYDRALAIRPDNAEALNNRGVTLHYLRRSEDALASFDRALALRPDYTEALRNRGNSLRDLHRYEEALASSERALDLQPERAEVLCNHGDALQAIGHYEDALASYEQALAIRPDYPHLFGNWLHAKMKLCDWNGLNAAFVRHAADLDAGKQIMDSGFAVLATPLSLSQQRTWAEIYARDKFPPRTSSRSDAPKSRSNRIRVGYFSADFCDHPVAHLIAQLFERHDRKQFELIAFSFGPPARDAMRARIEAAFDQFIDVRDKSDADVALLARELGIDIAVDLMGFTVNSRTEIFARRAAPVQVNYLGYPATMGAEYIDYLIADRTLIPEEHIGGYTEKVVYLPHSFQVNDSQRAISERQFTRREVGLPEQGFVFCCFNNSLKFTPDVFDIWMRLLQQVEGSVLWLAETHPTAEKNLRKEAQARGISPDRLIFKKRTELLADHLAQLRLADLFLDTLPYNAHTTASDALWAGVPVLTRLGETYASRVAASLLKAVGLPELITHSAQDYAALAIELASNPPKLAALKQRLAANRLTCPLFDTALFTRHIEAAYKAMWQRQQAGLAPERIAVPV